MLAQIGDGHGNRLRDAALGGGMRAHDAGVAGLDGDEGLEDRGSAAEPFRLSQTGNARSCGNRCGEAFARRSLGLGAEGWQDLHNRHVRQADRRTHTHLGPDRPTAKM